MDIETYLSEHSIEIYGPDGAKRKIAEDPAAYGGPRTVALIKAESVVPYSLPDVIVGLMHFSHNVGVDIYSDIDRESRYYTNQYRNQSDQICFLITESSSLIVSFAHPEVSYIDDGVEYDLLSNSDAVALAKLVRRYMDVGAADLFDKNNLISTIPDSVNISILLSKFDSSKYAAILNSKNQYLNRLIGRIKKNFPGFTLYNPSFLYDKDYNLHSIIASLYNIDPKDWTYSDVGHFFLGYDDALDKLDISPNIDFIYYQLHCDSFLNHVAVEPRNKITIELSWTFTKYSNEDYFSHGGPGYFLALLKNTCSSNYQDPKGLEKLRIYLGVPMIEDTQELCTALKREFIYLEPYELMELKKSVLSKEEGEYEEGEFLSQNSD
jgi:hypothetical protein